MSSSSAKQAAHGALGLYNPRGQTSLVGSEGPTGPTGPGETVGQVAFDFSTPSPLLLQTVTPGLVLNRCAIVIVTPFDDPAARIEVGTSANPSLVFAQGEVVAVAPGNTFNNSSLYPFETNDFLLLTISPGASTQGSGILLYKAR
jgi:hypothetical protein